MPTQTSPGTQGFSVRTVDDQVELIEDVVSRVMDRLHSGWSMDKSSDRPRLVLLPPTGQTPAKPTETAR